MAALVSIGTISIAGSSNCTGIFNGQNMQNNWDSHAPAMTALGGMMGNWDVKTAYVCRLESQSLLGQPTYDQDIKANASPMWMGP